jgi:serine/threonine-protein kinase
VNELAPGDVIGGYRVAAPVAPGEYRAVHDATGRHALLEVASSEIWREAAVRMMRDARVLAALDHANIARVVQRGVAPGPRAWQAVEVPAGTTLDDVLAKRALVHAEVVAVLRDVADALAFAHARGVVHGALAPSSVWVGASADGAPP